MENRPVPLGVLISGRGSNLQALIEAERAGRLGAQVVVVISNRDEARGLERARQAGIEALVMPHGEYPSREAYDRALATTLQAREVALVCLAGFMRRLGPGFLDAFPDAVLNIHPSLLPAFPGLDGARQALAHGVKVTAIIAGGMRTPFLLDRFPELDPGLLQDPAHVARAVRFVLGQPEETVVPEITVLPMRETSWP